jgi:hypothetical protein
MVAIVNLNLPRFINAPASPLLLNRAVSREDAMAARAFVLLAGDEKDLEKIAGILRGRNGVKMVDFLEKPYGIIAVMEAEERAQLADLTIGALAAVDPLTTRMELVTTRN